MKKNIIVALILIVVLGVGVFIFFNRSQGTNQEQVVLEKTLDISKEYASLRYQTDNVLINAKDYADYDSLE